MDNLNTLKPQTTEYKRQVPLSQTEGFIALPSDAAVRLTAAQLLALAGGLENRRDALSALREIAKIVQSNAGGNDEIA